MARIVDSYSEIYRTGYNTAYAGSSISWGQSFTGNGDNLYSAKFILKRNASAPGSVYAKLYPHSGTFGTSSVGTGSALATSDPIIFTDISSTTFTLYEFVFPVTYRLANTAYFVIQCEFNGGDASHYLQFGYAVTTHTHSGNMCDLRSPSTWTADAPYDACFYVYGNPAFVPQIIVS